MKNNSLIVIAVALATIAGATATHGRGFGGFHGGRGWGGGGVDDNPYSPPIPTPGWNAAYGGVFSGPPQLNMKKGGGVYNPLAGEGGAQAGPQVNYEAQRQQAFVSSLAGTGIQMGGFSPGEFGPPPKVGLPSDMGLHQVGGTAAEGYGRGGPSAAGGGAGGDGVRNWTAADLRVLGNSARSEFRGYNVFGRDWYAQHPSAWYTRGYVRDVWSGADWADVNGWLGGDLPNYDYIYGGALTYDNNIVCLYGRPIAAADKYYDSAVNIARVGEQAKIPSEAALPNGQSGPAEAKWLPLGVFEASRSGDKSGYMLFQLAVNKAGIIRGNYFDKAANNAQLIQGSVDKDTQRAAWVVADRKNIIFDSVLYNLTRAETPVLVHMGKDKNEQWTFVRLVRKSSGESGQ
jgi:hypothetical protein